MGYCLRGPTFPSLS